MEQLAVTNLALAEAGQAEELVRRVDVFIFVAEPKADRVHSKLLLKYAGNGDAATASRLVGLTAVHLLQDGGRGPVTPVVRRYAVRSP